MTSQIKYKSQRIGIFIFLLLILPVVVLAQTIYYVDADATGDNDGSSWDNAYNYLQDALSNASSGDTIWVAEGTYYPDEGSGQVNGDRLSTFQLVGSIPLYGGFDGTEIGLNQRNIAANETILSGDLDKDDPANTVDNTWHVVTGAYTTIDGFTITAGNASGIDPYNKGAGIFNDFDQTTIKNCTIKNNNATNGGGMYNNNADPLIVNCIFLSNSASNNGGGMYNTNGANPDLYNCTFSNNTASNNGDGMYNGSPPNLKNCIIWGTSTDQIYNSSCNPSVIYSNIRVASGVYNDGGNSNDYRNINQDPLFRNANSNLLLQDGSPCFGAGSPADTAETDPIFAEDFPTTDKDGRPRPLPASAANIDIGAYEQFDSDGSLPVQLFLFSASCENGAVILSWRTESEVDHRGFILERKEENEAYQTIASYETHDELKGEDNTSASTDYEYMDENVIPGTTYHYRLSDVSVQGHITQYPPISITVNEPPRETKLHDAYPNPFNPRTYIGYHLPERTRVRLTVVDMLGRKVKNLYNDMQNAGKYHVYWNGQDNAGNRCPSGVYIIRLQTADITRTKKVMLLK